jgi:protein-S-isoprenylcysteine O-methyltransferase Ste14
MGGSYLVILFIGAVIVLVDGQLILRKSPSYLNEVYRNSGRARQLSGLVAVLFHLVMLGVVALVASIGLDPDAGPRAIISRIGVLLLLTALGHAATIGVLSRLRDQQLSTQVAEAQVEATQTQADQRRSRTRAPRRYASDDRADGHQPSG